MDGDVPFVDIGSFNDLALSEVSLALFGDVYVSQLVHCVRVCRDVFDTKECNVCNIF